MLIELYSPETVMLSDVRRKILNWYARFDLFAGLMSGYETVLAREWFYVCQQYHRQQMQLHPDNLNCKIERAIADHRLTALDMSTLFAKLARGSISLAEFMKQNLGISERISAWRHTLDPELTDPSYAVTSFAGARERDPNDIVDPYLPGGLYQGPLWTMNYLLIDWCAVSLMHKHQTAFILQQQPSEELEALALEQLRLFEAIEYWPGSPSGAVLAAQASLGIASLFLPKDERHIMWCRKKLATIESMGYVYRIFLSDCIHSWYCRWALIHGDLGELGTLPGANRDASCVKGTFTRQLCAPSCRNSGTSPNSTTGGWTTTKVTRPSSAPFAPSSRTAP